VPGRQLAQVNVAVMRAPLGDPVMRRFVFAFDAIARLASESSGFVWQHKTASGHQTVMDGGTEQVVNLSVWEDYPSLHAFVYRSGHGRLLLRRFEWFLPTRQPSTALWWIDSGTTPNVDEALARLGYLRTYGPSPKAFSLLRQFDEDGSPVSRRSTQGPRMR
jgi:hypothetical protein